MLDYEWQKRIAKVCKKYKWYHYTYGWNLQGLVSDQEIKDGVKYLEKL